MELTNKKIQERMEKFHFLLNFYIFILLFYIFFAKNII